MEKNKMEDVNTALLSKPKSIKDTLKEPKESGSFIRVNFFISKKQRDKLIEYTKELFPPHIKISQSALIRYFIETCNPEEIRKNYFELK
jgi:hypothetical protein